MQMDEEDLIHVRLLFSLQNNLGDCFTRGAKWEHVPLCCWVYPLQPCIIHSAAGLMGQLINSRLVYPREQLITHLQRGSTQEHQSALQRSEWLPTHGWAEQQRGRHPPPLTGWHYQDKELQSWRGWRLVEHGGKLTSMQTQALGLMEELEKGCCSQ